MPWLPTVTLAMIDRAANDKYLRYRVPGTNVILYHLDSTCLGKCYIYKDNLRDPYVDEGIDDMIDESREDSIDNDHDWNILTDDIGINGPHSPGAGDGHASSGVGTPFPGEPHIDKTDIKESDMIGMTRVQYQPSGSINFSTTADMYFWSTFMIPAEDTNNFYIPPSNLGTITGDNDLFLVPGVFPMPSGHVERVSECTAVGVGTPDDGTNGFASDTATALLHMAYCRQAYNANYLFEKAPIEPALRAAPGDRRVTLYWDSLAEYTADPYLVSIGLLAPGQSDFEGYHIYRSTDPAFTNVDNSAPGHVSESYYAPIATFDIPHDGIKGFDTSLSIPDFNGASGIPFYMGTDTMPMVHSWVDTTVQNGQTYYYAIRAFSKPYDQAGYPPMESPSQISIASNGTVTFDKSVARVTPEPPAAGFIPSAVNGGIKHVAGFSTASVAYTIVDATKVINNRTYRITFEDTTIVHPPGTPDTTFTKCFTLAVVQRRNPDVLDTLIARKRAFADSVEQPLENGVRLSFHNVPGATLDTGSSRWNDPYTYSFAFSPATRGFFVGESKLCDYLLIIDTVGVDSSINVTVPSNANGTPGFIPLVLTAKPVNYRVYNLFTKQYVKTGFFEADGNDGKFSVSDSAPRLGAVPQLKTDYIYFLEPNAADSLVFTWEMHLQFDASLRNPAPRDTARIVLKLPFLSSDVYEFTATGERVNAAAATAQMANIKVVPNPYILQNSWESQNPYSGGEPSRTLHFNHLPTVCTIDIYTVSGGLVATLHHNAPIYDGTEAWNMLTKENLPIAYGIYVYHVTAPGVGERTGKFAVIK